MSDVGNPLLFSYKVGCPRLLSHIRGSCAGSLVPGPPFENSSCNLRVCEASEEDWEFTGSKKPSLPKMLEHAHSRICICFVAMRLTAQRPEDGTISDPACSKQCKQSAATCHAILLNGLGVKEKMP